MKKKWFALLVAIVLLSVSATSLAATPSKTTEDMAHVWATRTSTGMLLSGFITFTQEPTALATEQLAAMRAYVGSGEPIAGYFPADVQQQIAALMPDAAQSDTLTMAEFASLALLDYQDEYGDMVFHFIFATQFNPEQTLIAMVGYTDDDGQLVWVALAARATPEGELQFDVSAELASLLGNNILVAILVA